jgi:hypothetical protein
MLLAALNSRILLALRIKFTHDAKMAPVSCATQNGSTFEHAKLPGRKSETDVEIAGFKSELEIDPVVAMASGVTAMIHIQAGKDERGVTKDGRHYCSSSNRNNRASSNHFGK